MGVVTTVDEHLMAAKDALERATEHLHEALKTNAWGYDSLNKEYVQDLWSVFVEIKRAIIKIQ